MSRTLRDGVVAGLVAAVPSGAPSTLHALVTGADPLAASVAAGSLVTGLRAPRWARIVAAVPVHLALSLLWGVVLSRVLPPRPAWRGGALAGLAIAAFDLAIVGRRNRAIGALPTGPQVADHVAYGVIVAWVLRRTDALTPAPPPGRRGR